ncbi:MAG: cupredoxin domain-containing protein [Nitrospirales bacterium]
MNMTPEIHIPLLGPRILVSGCLIATLIWSILVFPVWSGTPTSLTPTPNLEALEVTINIRSREFRPDSLTVTVGQKTRLVLKNLDTELHAFVPVGLLADSHVAVSGNGAPQFAKEGFIRVLLPTRGQTEIVFTPVRPGTYPYFCDLPGHVMRGTIVVRENPGMVQ